jgi:hypothetical protein
MGFAGYRRCQAQRECPERFLHGIMWPMENYRPAAAALLGKRAAAVLFPKNTKNGFFIACQVAGFKHPVHLSLRVNFFLYGMAVW